MYPSASQRKVVIVNVSSIAGTPGIGSSVASIASKGGVNAMTLRFARAAVPAKPSG